MVMKKLRVVVLLIILPALAWGWCAGYDKNSCHSECETALRDDLGDMYNQCYSAAGWAEWDQYTCDEAYRQYNNCKVDCDYCYIDEEPPCAWWDLWCIWEMGDW